MIQNSVKEIHFLVGLDDLSKYKVEHYLENVNINDKAIFIHNKDINILRNSIEK